MNSLITRGMSWLLILCFIGDPVRGYAISAPLSARPTPARTSPFDQQALTLQLVLSPLQRLLRRYVNPIPRRPDDALRTPNDGVKAILETFDQYDANVRVYRAQARKNFEEGIVWTTQESAAAFRNYIQLYPHALDVIGERLRKSFGDQRMSDDFWNGMRAALTPLIQHRYDKDMAVTFFYSVERRAMSERSIPVEYADDGVDKDHPVQAEEPVITEYHVLEPADIESSVELMLRKAFPVRYEDYSRDARETAQVIRQTILQQGGGTIQRIEMLSPVFFRNRGAYLMGLIHTPDKEIPFVLTMVNEGHGIEVDTPLLGVENIQGCCKKVETAWFA